MVDDKIQYLTIQKAFSLLFKSILKPEETFLTWIPDNVHSQKPNYPATIKPVDNKWIYVQV